MVELVCGPGDGVAGAGGGHLEVVAVEQRGHQ